MFFVFLQGITLVGRGVEMATCQIANVGSSWRAAVFILEKFGVTEGWANVGSDLKQRRYLVAHSGRVTV